MKKRSAKLLAVWMVLALCAGLMAGCGGKKETGEKPAEEAGAGGEAASAKTIEAVGTLEDITMSEVTLRVNDGRVLTFDAEGVEHSFSYGVDKGNWITVIHEGEVKDTDTSSVKVIRIHDEDTEYVKEIKGQTTIKDADDTVYALEDLEVRDNYMMASNPVGKMKARESAKRTGICNNGWNRIEYNGKEAYAYGSLLTTKQNESGNKGSLSSYSQLVKLKEMKENVYAKSDLTVRSGYSTAAASIGALKAGSAVTRTGICDNGWSRILYNGKVGFVYSDVLTTVNPNSRDSGVKVTGVNETVYATGDLKIMSTWANGGTVLGTVKTGDVIIRNGILANGYSRVSYYGKTGYVKSDRLSKTDPKKVATVTVYKTAGKAWTTTRAYVRKTYSVSSKALGVLRKGKAVKVTGVTDNNWSRVEYKGQTGYINNDLLTSTNPNPVKNDIKSDTDKKNKEDNKKKKKDKEKVKPVDEKGEAEGITPEEDQEKKEDSESSDDQEKKEETQPSDNQEKKEETQPSDNQEKKEETKADEVKVPDDAKTITGTVRGYDLKSLTIEPENAEGISSKGTDRPAEEPKEEGSGEDKYPSKTYDSVDGKETTLITFDIRDAAQSFKSGISKGLKVKIWYKGDLSKMEDVKVYKVSAATP